MKSSKRNNQKNINSKSPSPINRSRSRNKDEANYHNHNYNHSSKNGLKEEGKLYLSNIPINFNQQKIKEEFEKYGCIKDYSLRKRTDVPNPYYYGYITFLHKSDSEKAMENISKIFNWTVMPFNRDSKDKNLNKEKNLNNYNLNLNCLNKSNIKEDNISSDNIKVREIFVQNLPLSTIESDLYKEFFIYGEISKIELKPFGDKKNAFIKYRLVSSASKAYEKANNMNFNGNIIKISLNKGFQRKDILGDELGYELNENNCKLIVICLSKNIEAPKEENILNIFEEFGEIKNMIIKNISNINHIFIEYYKFEDAKKAVDEMNNKINIEKRKILGDQNCEINFYFKNKLNEINPILSEENKLNILNTKVLNNMNNNLSFNNILINNLAMVMGLNRGNPSLFSQLNQNNLLNNQFNFNKLNNNINNVFQNSNQDLNNQFQKKENNISNNSNLQFNNLILSNLLNNLLNNNSLSSKLNFPFMKQPSYPNFPAIPQNFQNFDNLQNNQNPINSIQNQNMNKIPISLFSNNPSISNIINNNFNNQININNNNINNVNNNKNENNNDVKDLINKIMLNKNNEKKNNNSDSDVSSVNGSQKSAEEMDFEKEYSLEEENLQYIWNGFLTKNNKDKITVDLYKIRGKIDDSYFNKCYLNICNRIQYEEVMKKHLLGIVAISPQNITEKEIFDQYVNYLDERQRCGVINLSQKYVLYIVSPGEFSQKFYINPKKHLLGLLIDITVKPNLYVDMNNLTLPPPVISSTEKRRLMIKNKKNENTNECSSNNSNDLFMKLKEEIKKYNEDLDEDNKKNVDEILKKNQNIKEMIEKLTKKNE